MTASSHGPERSVAARLRAGASLVALGALASVLAPGVLRADPASNVNIVADGRTRTSVVTTNGVTSVTTGTVSNQTGFNSFSSFRQGAGSTVNLHLPKGTANLVNIVHGSAVQIDGVLNAYKDGQIGGNVYFADPQGFIVGQSGVINVGKLSVSTPTRAFTDSIVGADGRVNATAAALLMRGEVPLSADGVISIAGKINAKNGITLNGHDVSVVGPQGAPLTGKDLSHTEKFDATVNTKGMARGAALVSRNGVISILAAGQVRIGGSVKVGASATGKGGKIKLRSGGDTVLGADAVLSADGAGANGKGGDISVIAGGRLDALTGLTISARGAGLGAGGDVELSGKVAQIGALNLDLGSDLGTAGRLLIDPTDLVVDAGSSFVTGGASVDLQADASITVVGGGTIDTTNSGGASGDITLTAPNIAINAGGLVTAAAVGGGTAGTVTFNATAADGGTAQINIAGTVLGGDIALNATATAAPLTILAAAPTAHAAISLDGATITASNRLSVLADAGTAASTSTLPLPVGVVVTDVSASVDVTGATKITAASADLQAHAKAVNEITTQSLAPSSASADGAVAVSTVTSAATVHVGDSADLNVAGALSLGAINDVVSHADATPQAAAFGASVAVSVVTATTTASIDGAAQITAGSLGLSAATSTDIVVNAGAAAGGATAPESGSEASKYLNDPKYQEGESTSDGKVSVVGALAISDLTSTTGASMSSTKAATVAGALSLGSSTTNSAAATADGSAVDSTTGVGVALGLNLAKVANDATLNQGVTAGSLSVGATMNGAAGRNAFTTSATSGAGAQDVGVAGSLAVNLIDTESVAKIAPGVAVNLTGGAADITSVDDSKSSASALPDTSAVSGGKLGIGASVAINIVANRSEAVLGDNAALTGAGSLSVKASADHEIETEAEAGAEGGIALVPVLAMTLATNTTTARLGTDANTLHVTGAVEVEAEQGATETTSASAKAAGEKATVGAALALALVTDQVTVSTNRAIAAGGAVSFAASGGSASSLSVTAGAAGAKGTDSDGKASDGGGDTVDQKVNNQLDFGQSQQTSAGIGSSEQQQASDTTKSKDHSAKTSEGKLAVAAAIGINVQTSSVSAQMPDGVDITAGGALTVSAVNATDAGVASDASAAGSDIAIGVAASVNAVTETNLASLGAATYTANGVNVTALKAAGTDPAHVDAITATAKSGAGGTNVGVAGALALNLVHADSRATVAGGATVDAGTGASTVSADTAMTAKASATPLDTSDTTGGKVGVGASAALNLITTGAVAEIADGAVFAHGAGLSVKAHSAVSTETEAEAGSEGGIAVDAVVALATLNETTTARIGTGQAIDTAGAVEIEATSDGENTATGSGEAKGGSVGVGAAVGVIIGAGSSSTSLGNTSVTSAELARDLTAEELTINADSKRSYEAYATASAGGAKDKEPSETKDAESTKTLDATKKYQKGTKDGGKVSVAAAVGIVAAQDQTSATLDGVTVSVTHALTVSAANTTDIATKGNGAATNSKAKVGVGIGVALAISNNSATATIKDGATVATAGDVTVSAETRQNQSHDAGKTDFLNGLGALAYAGASASKVAVAGALAVDISNTTTSATIGDAVTIGSGGRVGAVNVTADNASRMGAKAASLSASKAQVGIGASVAVVVSNNAYTANIGTGADITSGAVTVTATNEKLAPTGAASFDLTDIANLKDNITKAEDSIKSDPLFGAGNYYTEAIGGAAASKAAVEGSFSVMQFSDSTHAGIGDSLSGATNAPSTLDTGGGDVTVKAENAFDAKSLAGGLALGGNVGVGISSSVIVSSGSTAAGLAANTRLSHAGAVTVAADASQSFGVFGVSAGGGGTAGVAGVASVLTSSNTVRAELGQGTHITATGDVSVDATNGFDVLSVAGSVGAGGTAGIGASVSTVVVNNVTQALVDDGSSAADGVAIDTAGAVDIGAHATATGASYVVAGGAAGEVAVGAGVGVFVTGTTTTADLGAYASVSAADVTVAAKAAETGNTVIVALGAGGEAGLAGSVSVFTIGDTTTAQIGTGAEVFAEDNVAVLADDATAVGTLAATLAASGAAGGGASVGVTVIDKTTHATIADLAQVTALGLGAGVDYIADYAPTFTTIADQFQGAALPSNAPTASGGSSDQVGLTAADATANGLDLLTKTRNSVARHETGHGVVVNAAASNVARTVSAGVAVAGGGAVTLSGSVPVIISDTAAAIGAARINTLAPAGAPAPGAAQGVTVAAASDIYDMGVAGALSGSGGTGGGAGVSVAVVKNTTRATVADGADMAAQGDVVVTARAHEDFVAFDAAVAVSGSFSLAGGVGVVALTDQTQATLGGTVLAGGNAVVLADDQTRVATMDGGVSVGIGTGGAGGAVSVLSIHKTTTADIAANADVTALGDGGTFNGHTGAGMNTRAAMRGIDVEANSGESNLTLAASAAGGLYAGVSGVVTVEMVTNTTTATIGDNARINTNAAQSGANAAQGVTVTARDTTISNVDAGGLAIGAGALAGTVDVGIFNTTTGASIGDGVVLNAKGDVRVNGLSNKAGESLVVSGSGGLVGVAAGVAVYEYGNGITAGGAADDELGKASDGKVDLVDVVTGASSQASGSTGSGISELLGASNDQNVLAANSSAATARQSIALNTAPVSAAVPAGVSANIGAATIGAGGAVSVTSRDSLTTSLTTGAAGVGAVGLGAGVSVLGVDTSNRADISGAAQIAAVALDVNAQTTHTLTATNYVGAGGGYGLVAAVGVMRDSSDSYAYVNGATVTVSGAVAVNVGSARSLTNAAKSVSVGFVGGTGASVATTTLGGTTKAALGADASGVDTAKGVVVGSTTNRAGSVTLGATSSDNASTDTFAAGGGIGAGLQGAVAETTLDGTLGTGISNAALYTSGAISAQSKADNSASANAQGVAVAGGLAVGVSVADATLGMQVATDVGGASMLDGGSVDLGATIGTGTITAGASATGGALIGVAGTSSDATNASSAETDVSGSQITSTGQVAIAAKSTTDQSAYVSGAAGGIVGVGSNDASASSSTTTKAQMRDMVGVNAGGLAITANGSDSNTADATSGSGGVVAGAAADATTSSTSTTLAEATTSAPSKAYLIYVGGGAVDIAASHTATFGGQVNSTQASVVGASGATLHHSVSQTTTAGLGGSAKLRAGNLTIAARSFAHNFYLGETPFNLISGPAPSFNDSTADWNVESGSGGLVNLPAGSVSVGITQVTTAEIGDAADIELLRPASGTSLLQIEAYNEAVSHQKAKLDSGGAIATAKTTSQQTATQTAHVDIGKDGAIVVDQGDVEVGAWNNADIRGGAVSSTYGLAGAPSGSAHADLTVNNAVNIGTDTLLQVTDGIEPTDGTKPTNGTISIFAGNAPDGSASAVKLATTVDLYNNTAVPISSTPDAQSNLTDTASVTQGTSSGLHMGILAAGDITIGASRGNVSLSAVGQGTDLYRELGGKIVSALSTLFGGGEVSFAYHGGSTSNTGSTQLTLNGLVATGLQSQKTLTISYASGTCDPSLASCVTGTGNIGYSTTSVGADSSVLVQRYHELKTLIANTSGDTVSKGAYQNELKFIEQKLVGLGLATGSGDSFVLLQSSTGTSPYQQLQDAIDATQVQLDTLTTNFTTQSSVVDDTLPTAIVNSYDGGTSTGYAHYSGTVTSTISGLSSFADWTTSSSKTYSKSFTDTYNGIAGKLSTATGYRTTIDGLVAANATAQADTTTQIAIIKDANSTTAEIQAAQTKIGQDLSNIKANNAAIVTASGQLDTQLASINTDLTAIYNFAYANGTAAEQTTLAPLATSTGALTSAGTVSTTISNYGTGFGSVASLTADAINVLDGTTATVGGQLSVDGYVTDATGYNATISQLQTSQATASKTVSSATLVEVTLDPVAPRLGNIILTGDKVNGGGTGVLSAPGNASVTITNNTAATLRIGDITMPTYDAGNITVNGVPVNSPAEVAAVTPGASLFAKVDTGLTSSRPKVTITSNFNPQSTAYHNTDPSSPMWMQAALPAPDIVIDGDINNPDGAVNITSEAGSLYRNGTIHAGSLAVLLKNGDFVGNYVNSFDYIGGDPAGFTSSTSAAERGMGIIANGAVSISARYLNINSTIQSGLVDRTVTLGSDPTLTTTDPSLVGISQSTIDTEITDYADALLTATPPAPTKAITSSGVSFTLNFNPAGLDGTSLGNAVKAYKAAVIADPKTTPMYTVKASDGTQQLINIKDYLSGSGPWGPRLEFTTAQATQYVANAGVTGRIFQVAPATGIPDSKAIGVSYNVDKKQYEVDGTEVNGGYIQLYGQIFNTSPLDANGNPTAQLKVLDGFGTINVTNNSGKPLVLSTLDAGSDSTGTAGRGTAGVIDITDITHVDASTSPSAVTVKHTVYKRDYVPGSSTGQIQIETQTGTLDGSTGLPVYTTDTKTTGGDRSTTYSTTADQRYVWTTSAKYQLSADVTVKDQQLFGSGALTISSSTTYNSVTNKTVSAPTRLPDGTYLSQSDGQTPTGTTQFTSQGLLSTTSNYTPVSNSSVSSQALVSGDFSFLTNYSVTKTGSSRTCNWWTLCVDSTVKTTYHLTQDYTTITTKSLKADNPIGITFIGSNTGSVDVQSNADVTVNGRVSAPTGKVAITASGTGSILSTQAGLIEARQIKLDAAGSVGARDVAVNLRMAAAKASRPGAVLALAGNGNVNLSSSNVLPVEHIEAVGDPLNGTGSVNLTAGTSILAADPRDFIDSTHTAALIQGQRVRLTAQNGVIGSITDPLQVNTGFTLADRSFGNPTTDPSLRTDPYYGLSAKATGDIGITSGIWSANSAGSILVDQVVSTGGDVRLVSPGQILDNNPVQTVDTRTYDQLLAYWNSLGLMAGTTNTQKVADSITAFENGRTADYNTYWRIRDSQPDHGATYDPNYSYTLATDPQQYKALVAQFTASVEAANPSYTDAQVAAAVQSRITSYEAAQTTKYHELNGVVGGLTASYQADYHYQATATETAELGKGSVWTKNELAFAISPGALKTVTSTNPVIKAPNVSGRTVTLEAGISLGGTVGAGTASPGVVIPGGIDPSQLTDAQRVTLAGAERSDMSLEVKNITLPANPTAQQQAEYDAASALGILSATTSVPFGKDYADLTPVQQAALNAAADGLVAASDLSIRVLTRQPLNFTATTALNATVTDTPTGALDVGSAYLASRGAGRLGAISVPGETRVLTVGPIANAVTGTGTGTGIVQTGNIVLESAQGAIGAGVDPLDPTVSFGPMRLSPLSGATITARAQGNIVLDVTGSANVDTIYSPQDVTLTASQGIANANNNLLINILGTKVGLTATAGDIGAAGNALNVGVNFGGAITASAPNGAITLYGPADRSFVVASASAPNGISLASGNEAVINGPVQTAGDLSLNAGGLLAITYLGDLSSTAGNATFSAGTLQMFNGARLTTGAGGVGITTTAGDALTTGITSYGPVTIDAAGHVLAGTAASRPYDIATTDPAATVTITSGLGIGDQTRFNAPSLAWPYDGLGVTDPVSPVANPLIIRTHQIALSATKGDIDVVTPLAITRAALNAGTGAINVSAGAGFAAQSVTSGGAASIDAQGDLSAGTITAGTNGSGGVTLTTTGALTVGSSTSTGSQIWQAQGDVGFHQITTTGALPADPGDVTITSVGGAITGGSIAAAGATSLAGNGITFDTVSAGGNASFASNGDIVGTTVSAGGTAKLTAAGLFDVQTISSGGATSVDAQGDLSAGTITAGTGGPGGVTLTTRGALTVGSSTSAGSQVWQAQGDVGFHQITTTGARPSDPGDVTITSVAGAITGGSIAAAGSASLTGNGISFDTISAGVDATLDSTRDIFGTTLSAGNFADLTAGTSSYFGAIKIGTVTAPSMSFDTTGDLTLPDLKVADYLGLHGRNVTAGVTQLPSGPAPLRMDLTGGRGTLGTNAAVTVDAPAGLQIGDLKFVDTVLDTSATTVRIAKAYVPGSLLLRSPLQTLLFDDRTPAPHYSANVQFFQPTFGFSMYLDGYFSISNAYTVQYNVSPQSADNMPVLRFNGAALVRESIRAMRNGEDFGTGPGSIFWNFGQVPPLGSITFVPTDEQGTDTKPLYVSWLGSSASAAAVNLGGTPLAAQGMGQGATR